MQEGEDVREHINKFFDAEDKLQAMDVEINKGYLSIMLLYSLLETFKSFRCAIESRDEFPSVESLKIKNLKENDARKHKTNEADVGALFANSRKFRDRGRVSRSTQVPARNRRPGNPKPRLRSFKCNKIGHRSLECSWQTTEHTSDEAEDPDEEDVDIYYVSEGFEEKARKLENNQPINMSCLDSCCTSHICMDKKRFMKLQPDERTKLNLANQAPTKIKGRCSVRFQTIDGNDNRQVQLNNALFVHDLRSNLTSVAKITDQGNEVIFYK